MRAPVLLGSLTAALLLLAPLAHAHPVLPQLKKSESVLFANISQQLGSQLAQVGHLKAATPWFAKTANLAPESLPAQLDYIGILQVQGQLKEAMGVTKTQIPMFEKPMDKGTLLYKMAILQEANFDYAAATQTMKQAIETLPDPKPSVAYFDLGVLYAKQENYAETVKYSEMAVKRNPKFAQAWNNYGYSMARLGQYDAGLKAVERSLKLAPNNANAQDSKGYIYFKMGRFQESVSSYAQAVRLEPTMSESYLYMAKSYVQLGDPQAALRAYETYLRLNPTAHDRQEIEFEMKRLSVAQVKQWAPAELPQSATEKVGETDGFMPDLYFEER